MKQDDYEAFNFVLDRVCEVITLEDMLDGLNSKKGLNIMFELCDKAKTVKDAYDIAMKYKDLDDSLKKSLIEAVSNASGDLAYNQTLKRSIMAAGIQSAIMASEMVHLLS